MTAVSPIRSRVAAGPKAPAAKPASLPVLNKLIAKEMVVFDDRSNLKGAKVLSSNKSTGMGVTDVNSIVRNSAGASFQIASVNGSTSSEGGVSSGNFGDTRRWLVLDSAGIEYLAKNAQISKVGGDRLKQLQGVFADPKGNQAPTFKLPNGSIGVAFIGEAFVKTKAGDILRYGLSTNDDPLD
jgi:hypothetical protein